MQSGCIAGMVIEDRFDNACEEYPTWTEVLPIDISIEQLYVKFQQYQANKEPELREYNHDAVCKFLNETQTEDCIDSDEGLTFRQVKQIYTLLEDNLFKLDTKKLQGKTKFHWKGNPGKNNE